MIDRSQRNKWRKHWCQWNDDWQHHHSTVIYSVLVRASIQCLLLGFSDEVGNFIAPRNAILRPGSRDCQCSGGASSPHGPLDVPRFILFRLAYVFGCIHSGEGVTNSATLADCTRECLNSAVCLTRRLSDPRLRPLGKRRHFR